MRGNHQSIHLNPNQIETNDTIFKIIQFQNNPSIRHMKNECAENYYIFDLFSLHLFIIQLNKNEEKLCIILFGVSQNHTIILKVAVEFI